MLLYMRLGMCRFPVDKAVSIPREGRIQRVEKAELSTATPAGYLTMQEAAERIGIDEREGQEVTKMDEDQSLAIVKTVTKAI